MYARSHNIVHFIYTTKGKIHVLNLKCHVLVQMVELNPHLVDEELY